MNKPLAFDLNSYAKKIIIGCAQEEQLAAQEVIFDVTALLPCTPQRFAEVWKPEFDYSVLIAAVDDACDRVQNRILQEPLALEVASRIFLHSDLVEEVTVQTRKTQRYHGAESVGCRLTLTRIQWANLRSQVEVVS